MELLPLGNRTYSAKTMAFTEVKLTIRAHVTKFHFKSFNQSKSGTCMALCIWLTASEVNGCVGQNQKRSWTRCIEKGYIVFILSLVRDE